jgi:flagellum-specific peptidoglycan hydrolase FlgJ
MEHPEIVMAQIRLESGNLESFLTRENNNFLGMKYPHQRPTTSIGEKNGFAEYNSWQDCLFDYLIWQSRYAKKLSVDEYYDYLKSTYAQDENYINKLKQIVNE